MLLLAAPGYKVLNIAFMGLEALAETVAIGWFLLGIYGTHLIVAFFFRRNMYGGRYTFRPTKNMKSYRRVGLIAGGMFYVLALRGLFQ